MSAKTHSLGKDENPMDYSIAPKCLCVDDLTLEMASEVLDFIS